MIYLFDNQDKLIDIIAEDNLIDWTYTVEINAFDEAEFELPIDYKLDLVKKAVYFGFFGHEDEFKVFRITEKSLKDERLIKGLDRAESDLRTVSIIKEKRPKNVTADQALRVALENTGYEVGQVEGLPMVGKTNFYYISPREALVKIIETWNCEFRVRYTFVENKISSRYIDLFKREGKVTGRQFYHGDDLLSIEHEESSDDVVTALIGRGKGEEITDSDGQATGGYGRRIEFTDIAWSKAAGKPTDKPAGQNYVVSESAREKFGLYQNGQLKHRWGVFVDEQIEDREVLLQRTWEELQKLSIPITTYKASLVEISPDIWKGDSVAIIRDDIGIAFEARIHKIVIDKLNNDRSTVELGDYATLRERHSTGRAMQQAMNEALDAQSQDLQEFLLRLEEEKERKNAEIDEKFRLAQLNMDNAIEGVKNKAEQGRAELATQIESKLAEQRVTISEIERELGNSLENSYRTLTQSLAEYKSLVSTASQNASQANAVANTLAGQQQSLLQQLARQREEHVSWRTAFESTISTELGRYRNELTQLRGKFDESGNLTALETYKRTQEESARGIRTQLEQLSQDSARIGRIETEADRITQTVESLNSDVLKKSEFLIEDGRVQFWSGKELNGNNIASLLTVQPEAIQAVTDKLVITSRQNNIVSDEYKNVCRRVSRAGYVMDVPLSIDEREFFITGEARRISGNGSLQFYCVVFYSDGGKVGTGYTSSLTNTTKAPFSLTSKFTAASGKTVTGIRFYMNVSSSDVWEVCNLSITPKIGAELMVDGSITADKLNINSARAGILTANSVTSNMIQSQAVSADKLLVNSALFDKFTTSEAFIKSLTAKTAFITSVQAIDLSASRIKSGVLVARNGAMRINLDEANMLFKKNASVQFEGGDNALYRKKDSTTAFLHFGDDGYGGTYVGLGATSHNEGIKSANTARFAGVRIYRPDDRHDYTEVYGDYVYLKHGFSNVNGFKFQTAAAKREYNMTDLMEWLFGLKKDFNSLSIKRILQVFNHNFNHIINITGRGDVIKTYPGLGAVQL